MSSMTDLTTQIATGVVALNSAILSVQNQANALTGQLAQLTSLIAVDSTTILQTRLADLQTQIATDTAAVQGAATTLASPSSPSLSSS